nr:hypothetical protein [Tanacetum cinerariifolium]
LVTQSACQPSLASRLSLLKESLLSVTVAHRQPLRVLPSLSGVSKSGSHVTDAVSGSVYSATVAAPDVPGAGQNPPPPNTDTPPHHMTPESV